MGLPEGWEIPDWLANHRCSEACIMHGVLFPEDVVISQETLDLAKVYEDSPGGVQALTLMTFAGRKHPFDNALFEGGAYSVTVGMVYGYALGVLIKLAFEMEKGQPGTLGVLVAEVGSMMADAYYEELTVYGTQGADAKDEEQ